MESGRLIFDPSSCHGNMLFIGKGARTMMNMDETSRRRPFFSSPDELLDEEYYEEQLPEKKRRLTPEQVHILEKCFGAENKLEPERKGELAKKLGLQQRQVAVWFQNRRARWKTKQLETDYDLLKSSYDSLLADYDSLLKDNEKLKSEVVSLTEKLQAKEVTEEPPTGETSYPPPVLQIKVKVEDRLSSGSGGSAVVDEDGPQLVDSGDSYFPIENYPECIAAAGGGVRSEGDDGRDDGRYYFSDVFTAAEQQHLTEGETLSWWEWP